MELQTLIVTMNLDDVDKLLKKMNVNTNCIIANQTVKFSKEEKKYKNKNIKIYNFEEKGVGLNRNNALMRADADIVLFADDDIEYVDNYANIIIEEFKKNPKADMIIFNLTSENMERPMYYIKNSKRINKYNCLRYGAVRMAVKLETLKEKNIYFSLLFGGGAKYSAGEDSLFILECIRKKMKVYTSNKNIGKINYYNSTWFDGYNKKFFIDKRKFFDLAYGKFAPFMCIQVLLRHRKIYCKEISFFQALKIMLCSGGR